MYLYANILKWVTIVCMAFGIIISIVGFVFPEKIYSGELLNNAAFTFLKISVPITLILCAVGYMIWKPEKIRRSDYIELIQLRMDSNICSYKY